MLDRGLRKRSQFIFVVNRGRNQIFWQTPQTARDAKPGLRIAFATTSGRGTYYVDTRERYGYTFAGRVTKRLSLRAGDYAVMDNDGKIVAAVERKTVTDFATSLVDASLAFEMLELASLPRGVVVVEGRYSDILRHDHTRRGYLPELIARLAVMYPQVPILFLETRRIAEAWVDRYLRLAHAEGCALRLPLAMETTGDATISGGEV